MSSSEMKDSSKFSGENKPNFSQTCSLLSKYLKEKGSLGDLTLSLSTNSKSPEDSTMEVGQDMGGLTPNVKGSQLTIFYGGQVLVFNDFPADKAKDIVGLASKVGAQSPNIYSTATTMVKEPPVESAAANFVPSASSVVPRLNNKSIDHHPQLPSQPPANDLPIARKASLARFFEKRKDRLTAKAPYQTSSSVKPAENKAWLGLAANSPIKIEPQF